MSNKFVVYRSSAGSGKTFTLVREFMALVLSKEEPYYYTHILAITFTNKATSEMKQRVIKALIEISEINNQSFLANELCRILNLSQEDLASRAKNVLLSILHNYSSLSILTIDKFVYRVVRHFSMELHLPMNVNIELDAQDILDVSMDKLLEGFGKDETTTEALMKFMAQNSASDKTWKVESALKSLSLLLFQEDIDFYLKSFSGLTKEKLNSIIDYIQDFYALFISTIKELSKEGMRLIQENDIPDEAFYYGKRGVPGFLNKCLTFDGNDFKDATPNSYIYKAINEDKWVGSKTSSGDLQKIETIKEELSQILEKLVDTVEKNESSFVLYQLMEPTLYPLYLLGRVRDTMNKLSQELNIVHISEFNKKIAKIIHNEPVPFIYEKIGERYHHFLIDEFQDTSNLQWYNLIPLVEESLSKGHFNMLVGDAKQAIYRWRGGDVEQFVELPSVKTADHLSGHIKQAEASFLHNYKAEVLGTNYRSRVNIIKFNNFFFNILKAKLHDRFSNIYNDHEQKFLENKSGGYVHIENTSEKEEENPLNYLLKPIQECIDDGYSYSDIAILGSKNKTLVEITSFLSAHNIQVQSSESLLLKDENGVKLCIAFLEWVIYKRSAEKKLQLLNFMQNSWDMSAGEVRSLLENDIKFIEFIEKSFAFEINQISSYTIYEACKQVLIKCTPDSDSNNPFHSTFLDTVFQYQQRFSSSIWQFLNFWEKKKNSLSVQSAGKDTAVQLLTIHKSKGLEFPVVIIPELNWNLTKGGNRTDYIWVKNKDQKFSQFSYLLLPLKKALEKTVYKDVYELEEQRGLLDAINVLYVAFTRAGERLYGYYSATKGFASLFDKELQNAPEWSTEFQAYIFGSKEKASSKAKPSTEITNVNITRAIWNDRLQLSYEHEKEHIVRDTGFGNLLHQILANVQTTKDINPLLELEKSKGTIVNEDQLLVQKNLKNIVEHPKLSGFYQGGVISMNEMELLDEEEGNILRPDRVVFDELGTYVIDYKTGAPDKKHNDQVAKYVSCIQYLGYSNCKGYLVYTQNAEVIEI